MANTVFRFGQRAPSRKNLEVYRDVSMDGRPAVLPETGDAGYFVDRLVNARAV